MIVSDVPGTTRDTIDTVFKRGETTFVLVDTAGLRRKRKQRQGIEYYSELRALDAADRADVALVLVDASEGLVDQDLAVADIARKANCSTLVVLSKWDISEVKVEDVRPRIAERLRQRPGVVTVSAKTGRGVARAARPRRAALRQAHEPHPDAGAEQASSRSCARARQAPSKSANRRLNLLYGTQTSTRPPRFRFFVNDPGLVTRDYGYWVENQLRERFELEGVPVSIDFVRRSVAMRAVVVGGGARGARRSPALLADRGHDVTLACRDPEQARGDRRDGPQPALPAERSTSATSTADDADDRPAGAELYVLAVPSRAFADVAAALPPGGAALSLTKGLDPATGERLRRSSATARSPCSRARTWPRRSPRACPSAAVIASEDEALAVELQHAINSIGLPRLRQPRPRRRRALRGGEERDRARRRRRRRPRRSATTRKAALITRGLAEMARLGEACGARPETFSGLAGMGDLIVTC